MSIYELSDIHPLTSYLVMGYDRLILHRILDTELAPLRFSIHGRKSNSEQNYVRLDDVELLHLSMFYEFHLVSFYHSPSLLYHSLKFLASHDMIDKRR